MLQSVKMLMAAAALAVAGAPLAKAQDCPRGELDKAYCDRDAISSPTHRPERRSSSFQCNRTPAF